MQIQSCAKVKFRSTEKRNPGRAVEKAQFIICLLCKLEDLSSDPQPPYKKLGVEAHAKDKGIAVVCWPASLTESVSSMFSE